MPIPMLPIVLLVNVTHHVLELKSLPIKAHHFEEGYHVNAPSDKNEKIIVGPFFDGFEFVCDLDIKILSIVIIFRLWTEFSWFVKL